MRGKPRRGIERADCRFQLIGGKTLHVFSRQKPASGTGVAVATVGRDSRDVQRKGMADGMAGYLENQGGCATTTACFHAGRDGNFKLAVRDKPHRVRERSLSDGAEEVIKPARSPAAHGHFYHPRWTIRVIQMPCEIPGRAGRAHDTVKLIHVCRHAFRFERFRNHPGSS